MIKLKNGNAPIALSACGDSFVIEAGIRETTNSDRTIKLFKLNFLKRLLSNQKFNIPYIGLAKKNETLIIPYQQDFISINLAKDTLSLKLIQRIRDETHRFAHDYFLKLRLKSVFSN